MYPLVSILWINYNSSKFIDIVLKSLQGIIELNYPKFEVIVVDNDSKDRSDIKIVEYIKHSVRENPQINRIKFVKLRRNRGFNTANNIAFRMRDKESRYVVLLNNDAVPYPDSLRNMVEIIESEATNRIAAIQGIITMWDGKKVDNMGFIVDEMFLEYPLFGGKPYNIINKAYYCTYVSGAYSIYDINAIRRVNRGEHLFDGHMFGYYDDMILSMRLWELSYRVKAYPFLAARHYGGASFGVYSPIRTYLGLRNKLVLNRITYNNRYKPLISVLIPLRMMAQALIHSNSIYNLKLHTYSSIKGVKSISKAEKEIKYRINLEKIPILKHSILSAIVTPMKFLRKIDIVAEIFY